MTETIRTIVTQDAEVDDQNSLRHLLLYANDIEIQGIIQTSSKFHWKGVAGVETPIFENPQDPFATKGKYNTTYRWPGTDWMFKVIDDYANVYTNLKKQDDRFPTPEYLRSVTKIGNIGYSGEMDSSTEGSNLIKERILDDDPRTLYIQVWGGTNTIARALLDIENEYSAAEDWQERKSNIEKKVVLTACGEQDVTYHEYIAENWPNIKFVCCLQVMSYAYGWALMPEGESKRTLGAKFMQQYILNGNGPLTDGYNTWADNVEYEGEPMEHQFGINKQLIKDWWGARYGLGVHEPYDFLSEGDSPTYLILLPNGLRTLDNLQIGNITGRYVLDKTKKNSKGEPLNYWVTEKDDYVDDKGEVHNVESMWRYVAPIQKDFAARAKWCVSENFEAKYHSPLINIKGEDKITASSGETVQLPLNVETAGDLDVDIDCNVYTDISDCLVNKLMINKANGKYQLSFEIPAEAKSGDEIYIILEAKTKVELSLSGFARLMVKIK